MDHGTLLKGLYDLIVAVPQFKDITGTSLGSNEPDPTLLRLSPPACWVNFVGDLQKDPPDNIVPKKEVFTFMFVAFIYLPMAKQNAMLTGAANLPLLIKIIQGVRGQECADLGHRWAYQGQKLALVNTDRMVYAQRYTVVGAM